MHYYGYGMGMGWGFGILGLIWNILVIVAVVWVVIMIVRAITGGGRRGQRWAMWQSHSALSILNERFAKGEIDAKEYEERKKALMGQQ